MAETSLAYKLKSREEIIRDIEFLRCRLAVLVKARGTLEDPDVLAASQELDAVLNEYYRWELR
ncbi:MAG TPA: aspartyl-phosphate phosphatase Spo0E family protein [Syntrophomonas sp.]|nr:aspartyl-phosphate phosphatase Spo0E family protein [Syntrophomonas sp.]